jgi:hypothetical protein
MFDINLAIDETSKMHYKDYWNAQSLSIVVIKLTIFSYSIYYNITISKLMET